MHMKWPRIEPRCKQQLLANMRPLTQIAYSPERNQGGKSVKHLCARGNVFEAQSTFPASHTAEEYAESHSHVMSALKDLHIISFQLVNVRGVL